MMALSDFSALADLLNEAQSVQNSSNSIPAPSNIVPHRLAPKRAQEEEQRDDLSIWNEEEVETLHQASFKQDTDGRRRPDYDIVYKQSVGAETVYLGLDDVDPSSSSCQQLVLKINLPGNKMSDLDLDVQKQSLVLSSPDYLLATYLPLPVDHSRGKAQWDAKSEMLLVSLPILTE